MMATIGQLIDGGQIEASTGFPSGEHNQDGNGTPHMRPFNVTPEGTINLEQIKSVPGNINSERHLLRRGDILFNNTNTEELVGKTAYWPHDDAFAFSNHMTRVRVTNQRDFSPIFFAYALHHHWQTGGSRLLCRRHVAQASIIGERFREISVPTPGKPDQDKAAAVLWKVQHIIEVEKALIAVARELKHSAMNLVFVRGLHNEAPKETDIGLMPASWSATLLGSLGRIGNGSTPLKANESYWSNGTIPWLTSAKVYDVTITQADQFVTPKAVAECHLPRVKSGSVLMAITGQGKTLGHTAVTAIETCVSQHIAYLQFEGDDVNPHFIRLFLESRYDELRAVAQGGGSTKGALTCGFLKTFKVPLPPTREEQDEITHMLMTLEAKIAVHERKRDALQELFKTLLHELMTGQIRVADLDIDTKEVAV